MEIEQASWSKGLQRLGTWLAVRTRSYQSAVEGLEESLGLRVSKTHLWRVVQQTGQRVKAKQAKAVEQAWGLPPRGQVVGGEPKQAKKMGIALDGVYINLLEEGWKEVKIGAVFEIEALTETQKRQRLKRQGQKLKADEDIRDMVRATQISYCAVLGSVDEFEPVQWTEAQRRGLPLCWDSVLIGDGAEWIDRIYLDCYDGSFRVVDWYHACEHLAVVARQAFAGDADKLSLWLTQQKDKLWRGQVHQVVAAINHLAIDPDLQAREANYFTKHTSAMNYLEFCEMGLPVGSGVVEGGGCKGVVEGRLKQVGMRWSRSGAEHMLILCCEYDSDRWQQIWAA